MWRPHKTTTFNDRTMTSKSNNMPPLEATEAPWTDAEMRIQEAMLSSETDAPEALEARVFEALDAAVPASGSASLLRRGALIVASGVAVAALLWPTQEAEVMPTSTQQEPAVEVQEALTEPNVVEEIPEVVMDVDVVAEGAAKVDVASQEQGGDLEAATPSMVPLENLEGLPTAELEGGNDGERFPLKSEKGAPTTERREATLEVKQ